MDLFTWLLAGVAVLISTTCSLVCRINQEQEGLVERWGDISARLFQG